MLSLDVGFLFTNVPISGAISYIRDYTQDNAISLGILLDELKDYSSCALKCVQFQRSAEIYRQKEGVAMGPPLGPSFH